MKKVLGKGLYCYKSNPNEKYTKIFLENHEVDMDGTIGIDLGRIPEFDGMPKETNYCGKTMKLVKHEFQIELERFGSWHF